MLHSDAAGFLAEAIIIKTKVLTSAAFYSGKQGLSPLLPLYLILKTTASILLYPLLHAICQIFSEVNMFSNS